MFLFAVMKNDNKYILVEENDSFLIYLRSHTDLSSLPSTGFVGSGTLFRVLQPFKPLTDAPVTEAWRIEQWMKKIFLFGITSLLMIMNQFYEKENEILKEMS